MSVLFIIGVVAIVLTLVLRGWFDYRAGRGVGDALILAAVCIIGSLLGWFLLPHVPAQRLSPPVPVTLGVYGALAIVFGALALLEWRRHDIKRAKLMIVYWVGSVSVFMWRGTTYLYQSFASSRRIYSAQTLAEQGTRVADLTQCLHTLQRRRQAK